MNARALTLLTAFSLAACNAEELPGGSAEREDALFLTIPRRFEVKGLWGRCLDFGPGPHLPGNPVFLYGCNSSTAQQVTVEEFHDGQHTVRLLGGGYCIGARGGTAPRAVLELQACDGRAGQRFQLDGDSILLEARQLSVRAQDWRGDDRTPLIVDRRRLDARDRWTFRGLSGFPKPTSGFIAVPQQMSLPLALERAHAGTVIELDPAFDLTLSTPLRIPGGVTVRGGRSATQAGARLKDPERVTQHTLLTIDGPDVRITGLRLEGPTDSNQVHVVVQSPNGSFTLVEEATVRGIDAHSSHERTLIDDNELSKWRGSAVKVFADSFAEECLAEPVPRVPNVHVLRNHIHHNRRDHFGYGVSTGHGGFARIDGNYFDDNRHAIACDGRAFSGYRAVNNLVSAVAPRQGTWPFTWYTHDFDIHGRGEDGAGEHRGGVAGDFFDISRNTFLATNRENLDLRGTPCQHVRYVENMSRMGEDESINSHGAPGSIIGFGNLWDLGDPTLNVASFDFDGDGVADTLMTTGATWYVKLRGTGPWRFWNSRTEILPNLSFHDVNNDGRQDVLAIIDGQLRVSWGGLSDFEPPTPAPEPPPRADPPLTVIR